MVVGGGLMDGYRTGKELVRDGEGIGEGMGEGKGGSSEGGGGGLKSNIVSVPVP